MSEWQEEPKVPDHLKVGSAPREGPPPPKSPIMKLAAGSCFPSLEGDDILVFNADRIMVGERGFVIRSATVCFDHTTGEKQLQMALRPEA